MKFNDATTSESSLKLYLREISEIPLLTAAEEKSLARRIKRGDAAARKAMIQANLRLVVKMAGEFAYYGMELQDLISEGNIGLMKAVEKFDPNRGVRFSTYAAWWIKQCVRRALANQSKTIRLPVHIVEKVSRMRRTQVRLTALLGHEPTDSELAEEMSLPLEKVAHLRRISAGTTSLDAPMHEGEEGSLSDRLTDDTAVHPSESMEQKAVQKEMLDVLDKLDPRERLILSARFGLNGKNPQTLSVIGKNVRVTRERIRQIQNGALRKMRILLREQQKSRN